MKPHLSTRSSKLLHLVGAVGPIKAEVRAILDFKSPGALPPVPDLSCARLHLGTSHRGEGFHPSLLSLGYCLSSMRS